MKSSLESENSVGEAIENSTLRNPTYLYPTWLKQDPSCFVN